MPRLRPGSVSTDGVNRQAIQSDVVGVGLEGVPPCVVGLDAIISYDAAHHGIDTLVDAFSRSCRGAVLTDIAEQVAGF